MELRISTGVSARRLWERVLTEEERQRLGNDFEAAWRHDGTAGLWMKPHGISRSRAVVEVAHTRGVTDTGTRRWLLRELGEVHDDPEEAIQAAVAKGGLVLVERPRAAYWKGEEIPVNWERRPTLWDFLWLLGQRAKAGQPVDQMDFADAEDPAVVARKKHRLLTLPEFPTALGDLIKPAGRNAQQLTLKPQEVRLFELVPGETLREHTG
jgi:hypothetical protein